ncbi:MAG TPA: carboxymuconolactone decarboxylase family protein [Acidimicrobiia bacterium]
MTRISVPPGGTSFFDHQPELFARFNHYYGTLWSDGVVDQATKEVGRLRNARVTGCNICKNLRFDGARDDGLTEELVDQIADGYEDSDLPERFRLAIRYADVLITDPKGMTDDLREALLAEFTPAEVVELTATITAAMGFSKAAVAFGPPPEMPVLVVPTPAPGGSVSDPLPG